MDITGLSRSTTTQREQTARRVIALTGGLGIVAVVSVGALTVSLQPSATAKARTTATSTSTSPSTSNSDQAVATSGSS